MATVYLGLGTNLGNKEENLNNAVENIKEKIGEVTSLSSFIETAPWGFESDYSFLNAALCVETHLEPYQLLSVLKEIELEMGRTSKSVNKVYSDRIIDIDILLYDDLILNTEDLVIPHPLMTERDFVMKPLAEIAGEVLHPVLNKKIKNIKYGGDIFVG